MSGVRGAGGGFRFSRGPFGPRLRISGGPFGGHPYGFAPFGGYPPPWHRPRFRRVTYVSINTSIVPPPVVYMPSPLEDDVPPVPEMLRIPDPPRPRPPAEPIPPPPPKKEAPKKDEDPPIELRRPPPDEDPQEEHARHVQQGREAFQLEEYGRAVLRFRQAIRVRPEEPLPYFLLAQALIAQGKYHEAHDAILAGLLRQPTWPTSSFRPLELYEDASEYPEHLQMLEDAIARHPLDPVLLFLYGYQLWFDGRQDEASSFFRRALPRTPDTRPIDLFLRALPPGETL